MNVSIEPTDFLTPEFEQALQRSLEKVLPVVMSQMATTDPEKMLLSAREAAAAISVCEKSLWSLTAPRGPIISVHAGSRVLYSPADLQAWIDEQKQEGSDDK